jgi:hypothetical protein
MWGSGSRRKQSGQGAGLARGRVKKDSGRRIRRVA